MHTTIKTRHCNIHGDLLKIRLGYANKTERTEIYKLKFAGYDGGTESFTLQKTFSKSPGYQLRLSSPQNHGCTCKAHKFRGHCKHAAALLALKASGRL